MKTQIRRFLPLFLLFIFPTIMFIANLDNIKDDYIDNIVYNVENRTEQELEKTKLIAEKQLNKINIEKYQLILAKDQSLLVTKSGEDEQELKDKIKESQKLIDELELTNKLIDSRIIEITNTIDSQRKEFKTPLNLSIVAYIIYIIAFLILKKLIFLMLKFVYDQMNNRIAGNWANRRKDYIISIFYIIMSFIFFGGIWIVQSYLGIVNGYYSIYNWAVYSIIIGAIISLYSTSIERKRPLN